MDGRVRAAQPGEEAHHEVSDELRPCPFCGGEAEFEVYGGTACAVVCQTCQCGTSTVCLDDEMRAVEAWNRRAERTCHIVKTRDRVNRGIVYRCSECNKALPRHFVNNWTIRYCPRCGAQVVYEWFRENYGDRHGE